MTASVRRMIGFGGVVAIQLALLSSAAGQTPEGSLPPAAVGAERHIRFSAEEVTWLSPDLSPDGETLVFDALGDLYVLPVQGGHAHRLTSGSAIDYAPAFTPDGKAVTFLSDRSGEAAVWQIDISEPRAGDVAPRLLDRAPQQPGTSQFNASFFDADETIAGQVLHAADGSTYRRTCRAVPGERQFGAPVDCAIERRRRDATSQTLVSLQGDIQGLTLSGAGRLLAFSNQPELTTTNLHLLDLRTGVDRIIMADSHPIIRRGAGNLLRFLRERVPRVVFLPRGRSLIAVRNGRLWRIDLATGARTEIPMTIDFDLELAPLVRPQLRVVVDEVLETQPRDLSQSVDGRLLAFVALGKIYVVDTITGAPRRLTPDTWFSSTWTEAQPVWSSDGASLIFAVRGEPGVPAGTGSLWRMTIDGASLPERLGGAYAGGPLFRAPAATISRVASSDGRGRSWGLIPSGTGRSATAVSWPSVRPQIVDLIQAESAVVAIVADLQTASIATGDELVPICAFGVDVRSGRRTPLNYLATVTARRGGMESGVQARGALGQYRRSIQVSPTGMRLLTAIDGAIAVGTLPASARRRMSHLEGLYQSDEEAGRHDDPICTLGAGAGSDAEAVLPMETTPIATGAEALWMDDTTFRFVRGATLLTYDVEAAERAPQTYRPVSRPLEVRRPVNNPTATTVLSNARVLTMDGQGTVVENADIIIEGARIRNVVAHGSDDVPRNARVIDATGLTILPGLIDGHSHAGISADSVDVRNLTYLSYGVTTVLDPGWDNSYAARRVAIGDFIGPRLFSTGLPVVALGERRLFPDWHVEARPHEERRLALSVEAVRGNLDGYETITRHLKWREHGVARHDQQLFVAAARGAGFGLTASHHDDLSLTNIFDGFAGLDHAWPAVPLYDDYLHLFASSGVTIRPTLTADHNPAAPAIDWTRELPRMRRLAGTDWDGRPNTWLGGRTDSEGGTALYGEANPYASRVALQLTARQLAKVANAGGRVAIGTDSSLYGLGAHAEMYALADAGMTTMQALRAGTINGAYALGYEQDLGSVEPGKLADLIILERNPLDDIRNSTSLRYVVVNGRVLDAGTLEEVASAP